MESRALSINKKTGRKPFWLPARSYYLIVTAFSVGSFILAVGILGESGNDNGIVVGAIVAIASFVAGVLTREIVLRHAREQHLLERKRLDANLRAPIGTPNETPKKFSLEMNAAALDQIRRRSEAANEFSRVSDGHMEVFELCDEYRNIVAAEIPRVHPDSPRLSPMIRGQRVAAKLQKFHLLRWAELESRALTSVAQKASDPMERVDLTLRARQTIQFALERFPEVRELQESVELLDELLAQWENTDSAESRHLLFFRKIGRRDIG